MSGIQTQYSRLTDEEFLTQIDSIKNHSPIIIELCQRLENRIEKPKDLHDRAECPVCQAKLIVDADHANDRYDLLVNRE